MSFAPKSPYTCESSWQVPVALCFDYELACTKHLLGNTTSKVLQTDSAYLPESLVRFLLLVRLEMLTFLAVRFTCGDLLFS
jgi:hypothetical protein